MNAKDRNIFKEIRALVKLQFYFLQSIFIFLFCLPKKETKNGPGKGLHPLCRRVPLIELLHYCTSAFIYSIVYFLYNGILVCYQCTTAFNSHQYLLWGLLWFSTPKADSKKCAAVFFRKCQKQPHSRLSPESFRDGGESYR
jgi:hypothetical protein